MSSDYPSFPEESARADQSGHNTTTEQPPSIKTAVLLMRIGAAISAVSIIVGLLTLDILKDQIRTQLETDNANFSQSDLDAAFQIAVVIIIVVGLIGVALWLWMASANGKGKKWARIVATVLGVLNLLFLLFGLTADTQPVLSTIIAALSVLVGLGAIVFMYRQDATQFYNAQSNH